MYSPFFDEMDETEFVHLPCALEKFRALTVASDRTLKEFSQAYWLGTMVATATEWKRAMIRIRKDVPPVASITVEWDYRRARYSSSLPQLIANPPAGSVLLVHMKSGLIDLVVKGGHVVVLAGATSDHLISSMAGTTYVLADSGGDRKVIVGRRGGEVITEDSPRLRVRSIGGAIS